MRTRTAVTQLTIVLFSTLGVASSGALAFAQGAPMAPNQQIASAVLALPAELRSSATVMGYGTDGKLTTLRKGTGAMTCLATNPKEKGFHVACYHNSMEPFMARGRELRAQGVKDDQVDTVRFREVKAGKIKMPVAPASMYQIFGGNYDPKTGVLSGGQPLYVVYIPYATAATTGLSEKPVEGAPWIMYSGTPKAHIMFTPKM
jgi:hypothetical protein